MSRLQALFFDHRVRWLASILVTLVLVACQENEGGGGGVPGY